MSNNLLNTIANLAHKQNKTPTKAACFDIIREAIAVGALDHGLTRQQQATLYNYFTPAATPKARTVLSWVSKAMAKNSDVRGYLKGIYSNGTDLVATDGHRLHIARGVGMDEGFYNAKGDRIEDLGQSPQFERVIPKNHKVTGYVTDIADFAPLDTFTRGKTVTQRVKVETVFTEHDDAEYIALNAKYLADVLSCGTPFDVLTPLTKADKFDAVLFVSEFQGHKIEAVIMGMEKPA